MVRRIADQFGVQTHGDLQVGFKWIGTEIDDAGPENLSSAAKSPTATWSAHTSAIKMPPSPRCSSPSSLRFAKSQAKHCTKNSTTCSGSTVITPKANFRSPIARRGRHARHAKTNGRFRSAPPTQLAGQKVAKVRDYHHSRSTHSLFASTARRPQRRHGHARPRGAGNYVAVRPSGTEPKVKFYAFTFEPAEQLANLDDTKSQCTARLKQIAADLATFAKQA